MDVNLKFEPLNLESTEDNVAASELYWLSTLRSWRSLQQIYGKRYFQHIKIRAIRLSFIRKNLKASDETEKKIEGIIAKADSVMTEAVKKNKKHFEKNNAHITSFINKGLTAKKEEIRLKAKNQVDTLQKENEDLEELCGKKESMNKEAFSSLRPKLEYCSSWMSFVFFLAEEFLDLTWQHRHFVRKSCEQKTLKMLGSKENADVVRLACLMYYSGNQLNEQAFIRNLECWNDYTRLQSNPNQSTFEEIHEANQKLALFAKQFELELLQESTNGDSDDSAADTQQRLQSKIRLLNYRLPTYKVIGKTLSFIETE